MPDAAGSYDQCRLQHGAFAYAFAGAIFIAVGLHADSLFRRIDKPASGGTSVKTRNLTTMFIHFVPKALGVICVAAAIDERTNIAATWFFVSAMIASSFLYVYSNHVVTPVDAAASPPSSVVPKWPWPKVAFWVFLLGGYATCTILLALELKHHQTWFYRRLVWIFTPTAMLLDPLSYFTHVHATDVQRSGSMVSRTVAELGSTFVHVVQVMSWAGFSFVVAHRCATVRL